MTFLEQQPWTEQKCAGWWDYLRQGLRSQVLGLVDTDNIN